LKLIVTEKYNSAKRIAEILFAGKAKEKKTGGISTFEADETCIIGLSGHIINPDFPQEYNRWEQVRPRALIQAPIESQPTQKRIIAALKKRARDTDSVTIATDFDREGELIGLEAYNVISAEGDATFDRVRFSALTEQEVKNSFASPAEIDFDLAYAGEARQHIDLIWGAALTRYISLISRRLGDRFLSVGRVQTPLLALLVDRERLIKEFKPVPYWEVEANLSGTDGEFTAHHTGGRFKKEEEARNAAQRAGEASVAAVSSVRRGTRTEKPPIPFNTTEFIRAATAIGLSAANAMRIAENLYTSGLISYPRTDNTVYPPSIDLRKILAMFEGGPFAKEAARLASKDELKPTRGKKSTTDHPPIHPVAPAKKEQLEPQAWKLYELVVRRFFATLADASLWETVKAGFDVNGEPFAVTGARLVEAGWRSYYPYLKTNEVIIPALEEGQQLDVKGVEVLAKETKPPTRFGQGRLVKTMEVLGLGTKSTRHEMIQKLYNRGYVHGNPLQPTHIAFAVIDTLERHASTITRPEMTAHLERDMDAIAEGKIKKDDVVEDSRRLLDEVFETMESNEKEIAAMLSKGLRNDMTGGTCPECGSDVVLRRSRKGGRFLGCSGYPDCRFTVSVPPSGKVIFTDEVCEKHDLYRIKIIQKGKRPWDLGCPMCNREEWLAGREEAKKEDVNTPKTGDGGTSNNEK